MVNYVDNQSECKTLRGRDTYYIVENTENSVFLFLHLYTNTEYVSEIFISIQPREKSFIFKVTVSLSS